MAITYSLYEAKARFSEVIRQVRSGRTVSVSYRGVSRAERNQTKGRSKTLPARRWG